MRVSTDKQELKNQIRDLTKYCQNLGYDIFKIYKDVTSGKNMSRPAFIELFEDAHKALFEVIVFWDLSRFSRSGTLYTMQKFKELENLGIDWDSYQEKYFKSAGQFKDIVISIMATLAKLEREKISERTKAGLRIRKRQGIHCGRPKGRKDRRKRKRSCWKKERAV